METKTTTTPKHVFLHLLMIAMLYATVIATITLLFNYANQLFFDSAFDYRQGIFDGVRWASSVLLVSFPVLVVVSWVIGKDLLQNEAISHLKTRRWLLYLTQFIMAVTIIIDLMTLIYNFYGGDLTTRFAVKVLVVLIVAAVVLGYYNWELRRTNYDSMIPRLTAIVVGILLLGAVVAGLFIVGSPAQQRNVRLDEQRINDLANVQSQVLAYTESKAGLPATVKELVAWSGELPTDPATGTAYTYEKVSDVKFKLCATFATAQTESNLDNYYSYTYPAKEAFVTQLVGSVNWNHTAGNYCFERTIELASDTTSTANVDSESTIAADTIGTQNVTLFYVDPRAEGEGELVGCGDTVTEVASSIAVTDEPVKPTLEKLFTGGGDSSTAHYNVFQGSTLEVDDVSYAKGIAVVHLSGQLILGGECDIPRVEEELTRTITQFDGVVEAQIFINGKTLDEALSLEG